jgi:hypothetical protein
MAIGFDALNVGATICDNGHLRKQDFGKLENARRGYFLHSNIPKFFQNIPK